jgi:hypothetical protein
MTLKAEETIYTAPSFVPRKRLSEPVHMQAKSSYICVRLMNLYMSLKSRIKYFEKRGALFRELDLRDIKKIESFPLETVLDK